MHTPLFTRFTSAEESDYSDLVRDLSDLLGARRGFSNRLPGILDWGLPSLSGISPSSERDREDVAKHVAEAIERFEPRVEQVRVIPVPGVRDFAFEIEAILAETPDGTIKLRVLAPRRGGGLGADVVVIGGEGR